MNPRTERKKEDEGTKVSGMVTKPQGGLVWNKLIPDESPKSSLKIKTPKE